MAALHDDYAFPHRWPVMESGDVVNYDYHGMTLRDWFAGQALTNSVICTGHATEWELRAWFGGRGGIRRDEIVARQAFAYADAILAARNNNTSGASR